MPVKRILMVLVGFFLVSAFSGCATVNKVSGYNECQRQVNLLKKRLVESEKSQISELEGIQGKLENELSAYRAKLEQTERGLVITFLAEVFFNSGQAKLRDDAKSALKKIAAVLNKEALSSKLEIEGHTDNVPIKHSGWKSNWDLASGRAIAVLHYFVDECSVNPDRLKGSSYGEFTPVESNDTVIGRKQNRRVEIVILPAVIKKEK